MDMLSKEYQPQLLNYQLVGDLVSIMIAQAANRKHSSRYGSLLTRQHYCDIDWTLSDLKTSLRKKHSAFPIAKNVILSIGYNDARLRLKSKKKCSRYIETIISRLRDLHVEEIIITNVPPCFDQVDSKDHWDYLESLNEFIKELSERSNSIRLCDIFSSFCTPKNFYGSQSYISRGTINYDIHSSLYVENTGRKRLDGIAFSVLGKGRLRNKVEEQADKRWKSLQAKALAIKEKMIDFVNLDGDSDDDENDVIIVESDLKPIVKIELHDSSLDEVVSPVKKEEIPCIDKQKNENGIHKFSCKCEKCIIKHNEQLQELEKLSKFKDSSL